MNDPRDRDDADLVVATLNRDERAFSELMRRHKHSLYRFVRSYVGDASEAHDLVQESFVSAWAALSRFEREKPFAVWLRRIALNKCRDWTRRRKVRAFFYEATESTYRTLCEGKDLDQEARVALRLAASHAARTGADVCLEVYKMMGTDGIFTDSPVGRFLQDALIVPQHAFLSESTFESAGRCMLGLECAPGYP